MSKKSKNPTPRKKAKKVAKAVQQDFQKLLKKHSARPVVTIDFPEYRVIPVEVELALAVISRHTNRFVISFEEIKNGHKS